MMMENNDDGQKDMAEKTADRVGRRWASSTKSQGVGRYSYFRKEFNGFRSRSTLPFGPAHLILSWGGGGGGGGGGEEWAKAYQKA